MTQQQTILLDNLHCINCVNRVEEYLRKQDGVAKARVNLTQKRANVEIDPERFETEQVLAGLEKLGFEGRLVDLDQNQQMATGQTEQKAILRKMAFAGCMSGNLMLVAASLYIGQFQGIDAPLQRLFEIIGFVLATPVVFYSGSHFYLPAARALFSGKVTMDLPITLGLFATYTLSVVSFFRGASEQYFDTVTAFMFVLLVGRYVQSIGMTRVQTSLNFLVGLRPEQVKVRRNGSVISIPVNTLEVGDVAVLETGDGVAADGTITAGSVEMEEAALTGESLPQMRQKGEKIYSGTRVFSGQADYVVEATGSSTALSRLGELVEESQLHRSTEGRLSSLLASRFSVLIILMATITFVAWMPSGVDKAILVATSVLVITCPCALGLALPLSFWTAVRAGVEKGVLVRDESALEESAAITDLVIDKTGTLTRGNPALVEEDLHADEARIAALVLALEKTSSHPFALTLKSRFTPSSCCSRPPKLEMEVEDHVGRGRSGTIGGDTYFIGRLAERGHRCDIGLTCNGELLATWRFADPLRDDAKELVHRVKERGLTIHLASGDRRETTEAVANVLGIESFHGEMLPEEKVRLVESLQARGKRVGLLGDGINDSPAMACANVGIAMGHAAKITTMSAPVLMLRPGLAPVLSWLDLSDHYRGLVRSNLTISLLYNLAAVPTAALGYVSPLMAAIVMPLASLAVVGNSLRLGRKMK